MLLSQLNENRRKLLFAQEWQDPRAQVSFALDGFYIHHSKENEISLTESILTLTLT
jgi:hypothetical protein